MAESFNEARRLTEKCVLGFVRRRLNKLDENWNTLKLVFNAQPGTYELWSATVNGPNEGNADVLELMREWVPRSALFALRAFAELDSPRQNRRAAWTVHNPNFRFVAVEDRTLLTFENCTYGYVTKVNGDAFTVEGRDFWDAGSFEQWRRSVKQTRRELRGPHCSFSGKVVTITYLKKDESAARILKKHVAGDERRQKASERKRAEEAARQEVSPQRDGEDKGTDSERLAAQAEVVHTLLPLLPSPGM